MPIKNAQFVTLETEETASCSKVSKSETRVNSMTKDWQAVFSVQNVMSSEAAGGTLALSTSGSEYLEERNIETSSDESTTSKKRRVSVSITNRAKGAIKKTRTKENENEFHKTAQDLEKKIQDRKRKGEKPVKLSKKEPRSAV